MGALMRFDIAKWRWTESRQRYARMWHCGVQTWYLECDVRRYTYGSVMG